MAEPAVRYRIGSTQEMLLKGTAAAFDILGFIFMLTLVGEVGTEVIGLIGNLLFPVWFSLLGMRFLTGDAGSKLFTLIANGAAEAIPFLNGFYPGFSVGVWRMVAIAKQEDREKAAKEAARRAEQEGKAHQRMQAILSARMRRRA